MAQVFFFLNEKRNELIRKEILRLRIFLLVNRLVTVYCGGPCGICHLLSDSVFTTKMVVIACISYFESFINSFSHIFRMWHSGEGRTNNYFQETAKKKRITVLKLRHQSTIFLLATKITMIVFPLLQKNLILNWKKRLVIRIFYRFFLIVFLNSTHYLDTFLS